MSLFMAPISILWWLGGLSLYFLPTIIAALKHKPNLTNIALLNIFLGWSIIGWVIALAISLSSDN